MRPPDDDVVFVTVMFCVNAEVLAFAFASVNEPEATVMTAMPPVERDEVKVAVYVVPLPEKLVRVPNFADTSADVNVVVDSLTVNVMVDVEPDDTDVGLALIDTVGAAVSYVMDSELEAVLLLPAVSVKVPNATETVPVPDWVLVVGVNNTEYTVDDVVVSVPIVPPVTVISPTTKFDEAFESVKVIVSVCPDFNVPDPDRARDTVGTVVSISMTSAVLDVCVSVMPSIVVVAVERTL